MKKERYEALEKGTGGHVELSPLPSKDELEPGRAQENDYESKYLNCTLKEMHYNLYNW